MVSIRTFILLGVLMFSLTLVSPISWSGGDLIDTNATTACTGSQVLFGNGSCGVITGGGGGDFSFTDFQSSYDLNLTNIFDQDLNTTNNVEFANVTTPGLFTGIFSWIINLLDSSPAYLSFNGSTLSFNETKLNETIISLATGGGNPFDQDLNTTNDVRFNDMNLTGNFSLAGVATLFGNNDPGLIISTTDTTDPTLSFATTNGNVRGIDLSLDESAVADTLEITGLAEGVNTTLNIQAIDGQSAILQLLSGANKAIIQLDSNDDLIITTDGGDISFSNRVGIGTASPNYLLEVDGNVSLNQTLFITTAGNVGIGTASPDYPLEIGGLNNSQNILQFDMPRAWSFLSRTSNNADSGNFLMLLSESNKPFAIANNSEAIKFFVDTVQGGDSYFSDGNVGIGTASPDRRLTIFGTQDVIVNISRDDNNDAGIQYCNTVDCMYAGLSASENFAISNESNFNTQPYFTVTQIGRIGIGTASPSHQLSLLKSGGSDILLKRTDGSISGEEILGNIYFGGIETTGGIENNESAFIRAFADLSWNSFTDTPTKLTFWTTDDGSGTATEKMTILENGNIGIGTTSPSTLLHLSSSNVNLRLESTTVNLDNIIQFVNSSGAIQYSIFHDTSQGRLKFRDVDNRPFFEIIGATNSGVFNNDANDIDFRFEGVSDINLLRIDAGNNRIGIGIGIPDTNLHIEDSDTVILTLEDTSANGIAQISYINDVLNWRTFLNSNDNWVLQDVTNNQVVFNMAENQNGVALTSTETILAVNDGNDDFDFRVRGTTDNNLIFANAGTNRIGIGTNTPTHLLNVNGNTNISRNLTVGEHYLSEGLSPTLSSCGTSPSIAGTDTAGTMTFGTVFAIGCTLTFNQAYTNAPACVVTNNDAAINVAITAISSTAFTVTCGATCTSDLIHYICIGI